MVLYLEEGALRFYNNGFGEHSTPLVPLTAGDHEAVLDYEATGQPSGPRAPPSGRQGCYRLGATSRQR